MLTVFGLSLIKFWNIFRYKHVVGYCNVDKKCFWDMRTGFSSLEILQELESQEDELK